MYIIRHRTDINSGKNLPKDGLGNIKKDLMTSLIIVLPISTIILILSSKEILIFCFFLFLLFLFSDSNPLFHCRFRTVTQPLVGRNSSEKVQGTFQFTVFIRKSSVKKGEQGNGMFPNFHCRISVCVIDALSKYMGLFTRIMTL